MANTIKHKRSSTAGSVPSSGDLADGELALNTADGSVYMKDSSGNVIKVGQNIASFNGDLIPSDDLTYDLGSASKQWHSAYIGPGSLYVNGQKVLEEDAGTIVISADDDQNIQIRSGGGGDIEIYPSGTGVIEMKGSLSIQGGYNLTSNNGNPISCTVGFTMNSENITNLADPTNAQDAATKAYVDAQLSADLSSLITVTDGTTPTTLGDGDTLTFSGTANETTVTQSSGTVTIGLPATTVTPGSYGSSTAIPTFTVDANGRLTAAGTTSISSDMSIAADSGSGGPITVGTDTLTIAGGTNVNTSVSGDTITVNLDASPSITALTTSGNVTIGGNLTVNGTTTTVNTETINLADNIILVNSNATGAPTQNGGIEIERGDSTNVQLVWDETADKWTVGSGTFVAGTFEGALTGNVTGNITGNVTGNVTGDVTGNADTATKWATARTITLGGDLTGSVSIDGSANVTLTAAVVDDSHNHVTGDIDGLAEYIADTVGAMVTSNTESGISVTYDDADNTLDFNVNDPTITLTGAVTGSATMTNLGNVSITTTATSDPTLTLAGDCSGSATFTNLGNATLTVTVADDSHNHTIANVDGLQAALDLKAPLASPALTGTPTAPTATAATNNTQVATTAYVTTAISNLIGGAPAALDTLNELAAAINDDASYASTITTALGGKVGTTSAQALGSAANVMTVSNATITLARGDSTTDVVTVNNVANANACSGNAATATTATNANNLYIYDDDTGDTNCPILFSANTTAGYKAVYEDSALYFDNTNNTLYSTIFSGTATAARYADLAEKYAADGDIEPGTVVCFGGNAEVQVCDHDMDRKVAGVVSTDPAYMMNSEAEGVYVALTGRVPCKVVGPVRKGDMMVSAGNGAARAEENPVLGSVIGKALENFDGEEGVIEVVVGRL